MKEFVTTIERPTKEEVESAVREKMNSNEGWEILTPILPKVKKDGAWEPAEQDKLGDQPCYRWDVKYFCNLRKVEEPVKKTEARKRIGLLNSRQSELIEDLLTNKEQLEDDIKRLESDLKKANTRIDNLITSREKKNVQIERLQRSNMKYGSLNKNLEEENVELRIKLDKFSSDATSGERRASVQGFYPAVIKTGKRYMVLGAYNTPEKAEEHEKKAYQEL